MRKLFVCVLLLCFMMPLGVFAQGRVVSEKVDADGTRTISVVSENPPIMSSDDFASDQPQTKPAKPAPGDVTNDRPQVDNPQLKPAPIELGILEKVKEMRRQLKEFTAKRQFPQAQRKLFAIETLLQKNRVIDKKTRNELLATVNRKDALKLYSVQGEYAKAADSVRKAIRYDVKKSDKELLLTTQEKVGKQQEWLKTRINHEKTMTKLLSDKTPLLKEKLEVLRKMDTKRKFSDAELKKMQQQLKQINQKLKTVNNAIKEQRESFAKAAEQRKKDGVILSAAQHKKLLPYSMRRIKVRFTNYNLNRQIARHLSNIAENTEVTWKDLKKNFQSLQKLQEEIWSLRKRLDVLANKEPLTDADYRAAKEIKDKLDKAISAAENTMGKIESAFIDAKTFNKLTDKEKLEFVKLLRDVWSRDKEFESLKPSLEELYEKIFNRIPVINEPVPLPEPVDPVPDPKPQPEPKPEPRPEPQPDKKMIEGKGEIILEGNTFVLLVKNSNDLYYPTNLPRRYMVNQLEVVFYGEVLPSVIEARNTKADSTTVSRQHEWWEKLPQISFLRIHAPQLPDEPFDGTIEPVKPGEVMEENINNQDRPANLLNAF